MDEFQRGVYNFSTASKKFKLIDEHTVTIFIPQEEDAKQLLKEIRYKGYTKSLMRKAGQYCVNVYTGNYDKLAASGMLRPVSEDIEDLYELCSDDRVYRRVWTSVGHRDGNGGIYVVRIKSSRKLILAGLVVHYCKCQYFNPQVVVLCT